MAKKDKQNKPNNGQLTTTSKPTSVGTNYKRSAPVIKSNGDNTFTVSHREFICDVVTTATELPIGLPVNPQNSGTFPWLTCIATRFEMYRFTKLRVMYKPSCATTTEGYIAIGVDFDSYDDLPSKADILSWKFAGKGAYYNEINVNCDSALAQLGYRYTNYSPPSGGDKRFSDLGTLVVLTGGGPELKFAGEIFLDYTVVFKQPSLKTPAPLYLDWHRVGTEDWTVDSGSNINAHTANNANQIAIESPGSYVITLISEWATSVAMNSISASDWSFRPLSKWDFSDQQSVYEDGTSITTAVLHLVTGAVLLTLNLAGDGALVSTRFRISTFAA